MLEILSQPWPWYVAGPLIGLFVPLLLLLGNKPFGVSGSLRATCGALGVRNIAFFKYDWKDGAGWNLAFVVGIFAGGVLAATVLGTTTPAISAATREAIAALGLGDQISGFAPAALFSWEALLSWRGALVMIGGGFLVGFGASYGGGCTSGHGITGLAALELSSLIAIIAMFAGGLAATFWLLPLLS